MFDINRVPEEFRDMYNPDYCLRILKDDPEALQYIFIQTEEMCITAIKSDWFALKYTHKQNKNIIMAFLDSVLEANKEINMYHLQYVDYTCLNKEEFEEITLKYML